MRGQRDLTDYLRDMLEAVVWAETFIQAMTFDAFREDKRTVFAVIRSLEIIGEAAKKVPRSSRAKFALLPWQDMTGMRDKLIHDYIGVDETVVWKTVKEDLPMLREVLRRYLTELG